MRTLTTIATSAVVLSCPALILGANPGTVVAVAIVNFALVMALTRED